MRYAVIWFVQFNAVFREIWNERSWGRSIEDDINIGYFVRGTTMVTFCSSDV